MDYLKRVEQLAENIIESEGMELVFLEFVPEGKRWILRIYIDKEGGVNIKDCQRISNQIGYELDVEDLIPHSYTLEVSSPGIDRIVGKKRDFEKFAGEKIRVQLKGDIGGRKNIEGILKGVDEKDNVVVETQDGEFKIPLPQIKKANLKREIKF